MTQRFKLMTENEKVGVWIEETYVLKVIKILKCRNYPLYLYFVKKYEDLTEQRLDNERYKLL